MPQFFLGLLFGNLFTGAELLGTLLLLPFAAIFFAAFAWGCYEAVVWYDVASTAYIPAAWYEWPWHWPGAPLSKHFFDLFTSRTIIETQGGAVSQFVASVFSLPKAMIAIAINVLVAMVPLYLLGFLRSVIAWVRAGRQVTE